MSFFVSESLREKITKEDLDNQLNIDNSVTMPICLRIDNNLYEIKKINRRSLTLVLSPEAENSLDQIFSLGKHQKKCEVIVYRKLLTQLNTDQLKISEINSINTGEIEIIININKGVNL
jgi:hypothetical protein